MEHAKKSALSDARERFRAGLTKRGKELRPLIAAFSSDPTARVPRAELQRRLHTLLASAQLFEESGLVELLQQVVSRLDAVGLSGEPWRDADRQALFALLARLSWSDDQTGSQEGETAVAAHDSTTRAVAVDEPRSASAPAELDWSSGALGRGTFGMLLVRVLLVCSRPHAASLRALLDDAPIELLHAADPEQALTLLHSARPACALVAAEFATLPDIDLVRRLQTDPVSQLDGVYLLLPAGAQFDAQFVRQSGADGVLSEPLTLDALAPMLERAVRRRGRGGLRTLSERPEGTVDEIASYVAEEVRAGIAEGLRAELGDRIHLRDTQELADAAWSAIGRVRAHLTEQRRGSSDVTPAPPLAATPSEPAPLTRSATPVRTTPPSMKAESAPLSDLRGRRVLVADDDPAVLWSLSGILREAGATVLQARDGRHALDLARRKRPQIVLSDILMPKIDGFALCRELRRDVLLERVPVILLSWKEDLLERMRELDAGASGYLTKEAGRAKVLSAISEALAPRQRLLGALRAAGDLNGRVEDVGVVALLESVAEARNDACITVQDAWNLFEIELREGQHIALTRTSVDGSFTSKERALLQLLGVTAGRFSVLTSRDAMSGMLAESLTSALERAGRELSVVLDAVSDARLVHVARLSFDEEVLEFLLRRTPTRLHEVVARFRTATETTQQLLVDGVFTPGELEGHLRELARRGAITGVWDEDGDDLLAAARHMREEKVHGMRHPSAAKEASSEQRPRARTPSGWGTTSGEVIRRRVKTPSGWGAVPPTAASSHVTAAQSLDAAAPPADAAPPLDERVLPAADAAWLDEETRLSRQSAWYERARAVSEQGLPAVTPSMAAGAARSDAAAGVFGAPAVGRDSELLRASPEADTAPRAGVPVGSAAQLPAAYPSSPSHETIRRRMPARSRVPTPPGIQPEALPGSVSFSDRADATEVELDVRAPGPVEALQPSAAVDLDMIDRAWQSTFELGGEGVAPTLHARADEPEPSPDMVTAPESELPPRSAAEQLHDAWSAPLTAAELESGAGEHAAPELPWITGDARIDVPTLHAEPAPSSAGEPDGSRAAESFEHTVSGGVVAPVVQPWSTAESTPLEAAAAVEADSLRSEPAGLAQLERMIGPTVDPESGADGEGYLVDTGTHDGLASGSIQEDLRALDSDPVPAPVEPTPARARKDSRPQPPPPPPSRRASASAWPAAGQSETGVVLVTPPPAAIVLVTPPPAEDAAPLQAAAAWTSELESSPDTQVMVEWASADDATDPPPARAPLSADTTGEVHPYELSAAEDDDLSLEDMMAELEAAAARSTAAGSGERSSAHGSVRLASSALTTLSPSDATSAPLRLWRHPSYRPLRVGIGLAALAAIGFIAAVELDRYTPLRSETNRLLGRPDPQPTAAPALPDPAPASMAVAPQPTARDLPTIAAPASPAPEHAPTEIAASQPPPQTTLHASIDPDLILGQVQPYIDASYGIQVGDDEALLVIAYSGSEPPPNVVLDGRSLGAAPLAVPISASQHQLVLQQGGASAAHNLLIKAGTTRLITLPVAAR